MAQLYIVMKNIYGRIAISEILPDKRPFRNIE